MHLILIAIILGLIAFIVVQMSSSRNTGDQSGASDTRTGNKNSPTESVAFISNGKLFHRKPGQDIQQISSPYVQNILDKAERRNELHSWKKGTSFEPRYTGRAADMQTETAAMSFKTAEFVDADTIVYFLSDGKVGGLFEQNLTTGAEKRLLHQQGLDLDHFHYDPDGDRILCSSGSDNGIRNLSVFDRASTRITQYTEGDTIDALPCRYPGEAHKLVMQSAGIGRSEQGHFMAIGPASLNVLCTQSQQLEPIVEGDQFDYMQPTVHPDGDLYYIRRPYEKPQVGTATLFLDIVLFPFRVARAFFHYLNFFSLMYSKKPLTTAAGPEVQRNHRDIIVQGKRIDAEKAQRQLGVTRGVPSLVPGNWKLICRDRTGQETEVASHVISFDISADGRIFHTNGFGVYHVSANGSELLFRDSLVEKILVH